MGRVTVVGRLVARDLRRRPAQALLLLLVITAAMATLTLGLILHGVTGRPYAQTRAATAGPDVVASSIGFSSYGGFAALAHDSGVIAHSGPYPVAWPVLGAHGRTADVMAEGRGAGRAAVDQPKVIDGSWGGRAGWSWSAPSPTRLAWLSATASSWTAGRSGWPGWLSRQLSRCTHRCVSTAAAVARAAGRGPLTPAWSGSPRQQPAAWPRLATR